MQKYEKVWNYAQLWAKKSKKNEECGMLSVSGNFSG
jgi:hypothetical protein